MIPSIEVIPVPPLAVDARIRSHSHRTRVLAIAMLCALACSTPALGTDSEPPTSAFLGRWDLTIQTPSGEFPSWINVTKKMGRVSVQIVGRTGEPHWLPNAKIKDGEITFISPKDAENLESDIVFNGKLSESHLVGTITGPDDTLWSWTGARAPKLKRDRSVQWGQPISLFNDRDFDGWKFGSPGQATNWKVEDGLLVNSGNGSEIISKGIFNDFKLHIEFRCGAISNSGVYLRGRYEVQVETDSAAKSPNHHTGAIYGFIPPIPDQPNKEGLWQTFDIVLVGRTVTVLHNGVTVIDQKEIPGITGGALDSHEGLPGPIYLQGSEEGTVAYRNILIIPAAE